VLEFEKGGVAPLDYDRRPRDFTQALHLEGQGRGERDNGQKHQQRTSPHA
jgi:hypothetical protein